VFVFVHLADCAVVEISEDGRGQQDENRDSDLQFHVKLVTERSHFHISSFASAILEL